MVTDIKAALKAKRKYARTVTRAEIVKQEAQRALTDIRLVRPPMSGGQHAMLDKLERFVFIACGTKTGKTVACAQWLVEGITLGERCAWVGPFYKRTETGFNYMAQAFQQAAHFGFATVQGGKLAITFKPSGGSLTCFSGDNPEAIYGDAFDRVVVDEGTRQPEAVWKAVVTTVTATQGKVRVAFNVDRGSKQWAIREFLRAQTGQEPSYGYVHMPTATSPYVALSEVERARRTLPDRVFAALYLAEVQDDGAGVFTHHRQCMSGTLLDPAGSDAYVLSADIARKQDWTVVCVFRLRDKHLVHFDRFFGLPWTTQVERIFNTAMRYNGAKTVVDGTGVGDVVVELLAKKGLDVVGVVITGGGQMNEFRQNGIEYVRVSQSELIEKLMVSFQNRTVTFPDDPRVSVLVHELDNFEFKVLPGGGLRYEAPEGYHDDSVLSFALGNYNMAMHTVPLLTDEAVRGASVSDLPQHIIGAF